MRLDIATVPFGRYGSYMAIRRRGQDAEHPAGLVLQTFHGDAQVRDVFLIEPLADGKPLAFQGAAEPAVLRLDARHGFVRICFENPTCIRIQARNVGVRLTLCDPRRVGFAAPLDAGRWQVSSIAHRSSYGLTAIRGQFRTDAPWDRTHSKHVIIDLIPGGKHAATIEGAIEELASVFPQRKFSRTFDDCVRDAQRDFDLWNKDSPAEPESLREAAQLAAYVQWSAFVAAEGHLRRPAMLIGQSGEPGVWGWGHAIAAMALCHDHADAAWDQLLLPFDHQDASGALPACCSDRAIVRSFVMPPIHGWALRYMMNSGNSIAARRFKEFYDPLAAWTDWWMDHRDSDRDGIAQYLHGSDSGWNGASVFDIGTPLESPDLSALLIIQMEVLSEMAGRIGKKRDAHRWSKRADQLLERVLIHNWRTDRFVAPRSGDHKSADVGDSLVLFAPIILGKRLPHEIRERLVAGLCEEGRFLTKHGLATESVTSVRFESDGGCCGPIRALPTLLMVDGLAGACRKEAACEIASRFCRTAGAGGMAERFEAHSGKPMGGACAGTSSVFQILARYVVQCGKKR